MPLDSKRVINAFKYNQAFYYYVGLKDWANRGWIRAENENSADCQVYHTHTHTKLPATIKSTFTLPLVSHNWQKTQT